MEITIKHVISLSEETVAIFKGIAAPSAKAAMNGTPAPKEEAKNEEKEEVKISVEQIRKSVMEKTEDGKRDEVRKLLAEYGAKNASTLGKEYYADFLPKLNAL